MIATLLALLLATVNSPYSPPSYACDGVTAAFTVPFPYQASSDLKITSTTASGVASTLTQGTDWSVNLSSTSSTSTLTLTSPGTKCPSGSVLKVERSAALTQPQSFRSQTTYNPATHEIAYDRDVMLIQQVNDKAVGTGTPASTAYVDQAVANTLTGGTVVQPLTWNLTGDGSTTTFSIPNAAVSSPDLYIVTIDGVFQRPTTDYTVSSGAGTITFAVAPALNGVISVRSTGYARALSVGDSTTVLATGTSVPRMLKDWTGDAKNVVAFGADPTNAVDSSGAFQAALNAGTHVVVPPGTYKIVTPLTVPSGVTFVGFGRPQLVATVAGRHILSATSVANLTIWGIRFKGFNSTTAPLAGFGGYSSNNTGLVTVSNSTDVRIEENEFDTFYNGIAVQGSTRAWITHNKVTNWNFIGIHCGQTADFTIDYNTVQGCTAAGATNNYGIQATGDEAGGFTQFRSSISFNKIKDIPSWSGIMSHDVNGLQVIGNDIRNVRKGIDLGHLALTNVVSKLLVSSNYVEATTTDTWSAAAADHGGIQVIGFDGTHQVDGVDIIGNIVQGFHNIAGATGAGIPGPIALSDVKSANVIGNVVKGVGTSPAGPTGIKISGTIDVLDVSGNQVEGSMSSGGIRVISATVTAAAISGNSVKQTSAGDNGILFTGSTITSLSVSGTSTNSTTPYVQSTSTLTWVPGPQGFSVTQATLGTPANGVSIYCSDCTIANPCAGGGTGAIAKRLNGVWVCN